MIKLDLVTGFLGAGKTTFIKEYARYLISSGERICIIENDFGAINVDMVLLKELENDKCNLEMIVGGDGPEAHKRRLKTKLISMAMLGFDRVIIEPSGAYEVDEFFDLVHEEPLDRWYEIGNVIAVVSSIMPDNLSMYSRYIFMSEIANAGAIIISKLQEASKEDIQNTISFIEDVMHEFDCKKGIEKISIINEDYRSNDTVLSQIVKCGYNLNNYKKTVSGDDEPYQTLFYFGYEKTPKEVTKLASMVFKDPECGNVHRIKGIIKNSEGEFYELNTTRSEQNTKQVTADISVLIIIGEKLSKEAISKYLGDPTL